MRASLEHPDSAIIARLFHGVEVGRFYKAVEFVGRHDFLQAFAQPHFSHCIHICMSLIAMPNKSPDLTPIVHRRSATRLGVVGAG
jgi:hypothetical protein